MKGLSERQKKKRGKWNKKKGEETKKIKQEYTQKEDKMKN